VSDEADILSTALEDYLETIHELDRELDEVRVSDIASRLGVKLPPVTRAVQALERRGFVEHEARGDVRLSSKGQRVAAALSHRHADVLELLTAVFGVVEDIAQADTCRVEHGLSPESAQRLHEFLEHYRRLDDATRERLKPAKRAAAFDDLQPGQGPGWRA
jgi:DtxR family Mn-dependent transcriptional regulator